MCELLEPKRIKLGRKLGSGSFASVLLAKWNGKSVAVKLLLPQFHDKTSEKCVFPTNLEDDSAQNIHLRFFLKEAQLLSRLNHR